MRFVSRAQRAKYVVVPARKVHDLTTGTVVAHPGLRARFFNHVFDSQISAQRLGWTDEERKQVERYLLQHNDLDKANGFYIEDRQHARSIPASGVTLRCMGFFPNEEGELEQCSNEPVTGGEYCDTHTPAAPPEPAQAEVPEPVMAGRPGLAAGVV